MLALLAVAIVLDRITQGLVEPSDPNRMTFRQALGTLFSGQKKAAE